MKAKAIAACEAEEEGDLTLQLGQEFLVTDFEQPGEGWWTGESNGATGIFPANHCQVVGDGPKPAGAAAAAEGAAEEPAPLPDPAPPGAAPRPAPLPAVPVGPAASLTASAGSAAAAVAARSVTGGYGHSPWLG